MYTCTRLCLYCLSVCLSVFVCLSVHQVAGKTPPAPTRGPNVQSAEEEAEEEVAGGGGGGAAAPAMSLADLMPKVDISGQIKSDLIKELGDKNWKIRGEALQKASCMVHQPLPSSSHISSFSSLSSFFSSFSSSSSSSSQMQCIIAAAKFVQPSLGDLPGALKGCLGDSNKNLVCVLWVWL